MVGSENESVHHASSGKIGDPNVRKAKARVDKAMDEASDDVFMTVGEAADRTREAALALRNRARDAYDRASDAAYNMAGTVDPIIRERPYAVMGVGIAVGLLCGLLIGGHGPKVIYVKPRD